MNKEYSSGIIDSRKYKNIFLLSKIIITLKMTNKWSEEEEKILRKFFEY